MQSLTDINEIKRIMQMFGKTFAKSLGQNFLTSAETIETIVSGSFIDEDTDVLEIGPGIGVLTYELAKKARKVVAVEIDRKLLPVLDYTLAEYDNVEVICDDIMKIDIAELCEKHFGKGKKVKVAANLPYYITTPIIMKLLEYRELFSSITVMVQKEVAERMAADETSRDYASLSIAVQYYSKPEILTVVPPEFFVPPPKVSSAVIKLDILDKPSVTPQNPDLFFKLVRASFAQRRKTLANGISAGGLGISKEEVYEALGKMGLSEGIRGEKLSLENFAILSDILGGKNG